MYRAYGGCTKSWHSCTEDIKKENRRKNEIESKKRGASGNDDDEVDGPGTY